MFDAPWVGFDPPPVDDASRSTRWSTQSRGWAIDEAVDPDVVPPEPAAAGPAAPAGRRADGSARRRVDYPGSLLDVRHPVSTRRARGRAVARRCAQPSGYRLPDGDDGRLRLGCPLDPAGAPDGPYVVVHPGASVPARACPPTARPGGRPLADDGLARGGHRHAASELALARRSSPGRSDRVHDLRCGTTCSPSWRRCSHGAEAVVVRQHRAGPPRRRGRHARRSRCSRRSCPPTAGGRGGSRRPARRPRRPVRRLPGPGLPDPGPAVPRRRSRRRRGARRPSTRARSTGSPPSARSERGREHPHLARARLVDDGVRAGPHTYTWSPSLPTAAPTAAAGPDLGLARPASSSCTPDELARRRRSTWSSSSGPRRAATSPRVARRSPARARRADGLARAQRTAGPHRRHAASRPPTGRPRRRARHRTPTPCSGTPARPAPA